MMDKQEMKNTKTLTGEQLDNVIGGVLDNETKAYIADFITVYKQQGSDTNILYTTGWTDEKIQYALSIWDKIKA